MKELVDFLIAYKWPITLTFIIVYFHLQGKRSAKKKKEDIR